jgi:cytosine/adenosine deaminase-related metal-dependent hydrolase
VILRARVIAPITRAPIENGAVKICGGRVVAVDHWHDGFADAGEPVVDLGEVVVCPGLVNAHCHLDYSRMAGLLAPPKTFPDWIQALLAFKATWTSEDFADSWLEGARMLIRNGVTTVADITAIPDLLPRVLPVTPLRVFSFLELIDIRKDPEGTDPLSPVASRLAAYAPLPGWRGLSPHAPYTASPTLIQRTAESCRKNGWRWSIHVAESEAEFEMFLYRRGPMFDWLNRQRDMTDCGQGSPVQRIERLGALDERCLAVHANYVENEDIARLAKHGVHVVHCPLSHAFFRHRRFPQAAFQNAGVNLCLGTDSLASVATQPREQPELSLFAEMSRFAEQYPAVAPETILNLVTVNAARALGLAGHIGEISVHACADLIAMPFSGKARNVFEALVHLSGPVCASMINGQWLILPQGCT